MARKHGARSKPLRRPDGGKNLLVDALVVGGVIASIGLIVVSVALNYRMGFRSADNAFDATLYGAGSALGDCLKAIAPFMVAWGLKHRDRVSVLCACLLFVVCTAFSFTASFGFAAEHRAAKVGSAQVGIDAYADLRGEKARLDRRLAMLGPQRSSREIAGAMAALLSERAWAGGPTVGTVSKDCTEDRKSTRTRCSKVAALQAERARAEESEALTVQLMVVLDHLNRRDGPALVAADAQVAALSRASALVIAGIAEEHIGLALCLLLACFLEIGSGLGLYMVTTPWRTRAMQAQAPAGQGANKMLGHVDTYMLARVQSGEGAVSIAALFSDYLMWCSTDNRVPYARVEFGNRFAALADEVGIEVSFRKLKPYYLNIKLPVGGEAGRGKA